MAYFIPSSQLNRGPVIPDNPDVQIIKQCVRYLSASNGNTESEQNLQAAIEQCLGRKFSASLIPFLKSYPKNFEIETDGRNSFISALTKLELCPTHCSGRGTCRGSPICDKLHICKFYLLSNSCHVAKSGKVCAFGHDLTTAHNKALLRENYIDELRLEDLRNLFKSVKSRCPMTTPQICKFYNVGKGCTKDIRGQPCPFLHLCRFYISGTCKFGKGCRRSHDLLNQQVKALLEKYGISTRRSPKEVLADLQEIGVSQFGDDSDSGSVQSSTGRQTTSRFQNMKRFNSNPNLLGGMTNLSLASEIDTVDPSTQSMSMEICIYHLRGKCGFGKNCRRHHKDSMYQWQFRQQGDNSDESWTDFRPSASFDLELNFSDVEKEKCYIEFSKQHVLQVDFGKMIGEMKGSPTLDVRRLTTESSAVQKFQPLATQWKWYWKDQTNKWIIYGGQNDTGYKAMIDSESLEQHYQENPIGQMKFATMGHEYIMDYQKMVQKNVVHKTERSVRRRPTLVQAVEIEKRKKKSADTGNTKTTATSLVVHAPLDNNPLSYIPLHWSFDRQKSPAEISDHFHMVTCSKKSDEYKKMKKFFYATMPPSAEIEQIKRIENGELWINFVSKREKMKRKKKEEDIAELELFHGTNEKFINAISKQGFDFRFSGSKTGNKYGKGSYFAKYAKTADSYTDFGVKKHMFVVRVLPGDYAPGSSSFVRPPPRNPRDPFELYDSCVDNLQNPIIHVIFTFDQVYPEYIIEYRKLGI
ncbi:PARP7S [Mytilus edulis]|uniref:PARP7S n=1 Tax=Mytilus edulis TaxID=6550 RepID=A0A8S3UT27_MYTED|nr:PARP7S [Mytilus edulis]